MTWVHVWHKPNPEFLYENIYDDDHTYRIVSTSEHERIRRKPYVSMTSSATTLTPEIVVKIAKLWIRISQLLSDGCRFSFYWARPQSLMLSSSFFDHSIEGDFSYQEGGLRK